MTGAKKEGAGCTVACYAMTLNPLESRQPLVWTSARVCKQHQAVGFFCFTCLQYSYCSDTSHKNAFFVYLPWWELHLCRTAGNRRYGHVDGGFNILMAIDTLRKTATFGSILCDSQSSRTRRQGILCFSVTDFSPILLPLKSLPGSYVAGWF